MQMTSGIGCITKHSRRIRIYKNGIADVGYAISFFENVLREQPTVEREQCEWIPKEVENVPYGEGMSFNVHY